jgi:hypothetical protein
MSVYPLARDVVVVGVVDGDEAVVSVDVGVVGGRGEVLDVIDVDAFDVTTVHTITNTTYHRRLAHSTH